MDTNGGFDVFRHDRMTGANLRLSVDSMGNQATGQSYEPTISGDGSAVVFSSDADDLIPDDTNMARDIFVRDLAEGTTSRISVDSAGNESTGFQYPRPTDVSINGMRVTFIGGHESLAPGILNEESEHLFMHDRATGSTFVVGVAPDGFVGRRSGSASHGSMNADGLLVAYARSWFQVSNLWLIDLAPLLGN